MMKMLWMTILSLLLITLKGAMGNLSAEYINTHRGAGRPLETATETSRYAQLLALIDYRSLALPVEVAKIALPDLAYYDGKYVTYYGVGFMLIALPFFIIGRLFSIAQLSISLIPIIGAVVSFYLIILISRKLNVQAHAAYIAGFIFLFATPAWAYSTSLYQHTISTAILLATIYLLLDKPRVLNYAIIALFSLYSIKLDRSNFVVVIPFIFFTLFHIVLAIKDHRLSLTLDLTTAYVLACAVLVAMIGMYYNYVTLGHPFTLSDKVRVVSAFDKNNNVILKPHTLKISYHFNFKWIGKGFNIFLASPDRGVLFYSPIMLISLLGIPLLYKQSKYLSLLLISSVLTIVIFYSTWLDPWGGWASGPRFLIPAFGILSIFLAQAIEKYISYRVFFILLFVLATYSLFINTLTATTSNLVPPCYNTADFEGHCTFIMNINYLLGNVSGSFIYNTFLKSHMTAVQYFGLLFIIVFVTFIILVELHKAQNEKLKI